jgi:pyruvate/2-oxoglutarate dehydrogenase complex dihydrolipoamide acyltransferase (E2) component
MDRARRFRNGLLGAAVWMVASATAAAAQSSIDPTTVPERNDGGWIFWLAWLCAIMGGLLLAFLVVMYMRYAPGFRREEESKVVFADRVMPGIEPPRRSVDLSQAAPIVVQPPSLPSAVAAASIAPAATAVAEAPAPAPEAPAAAPAPAAEAPAAAAPAAAPAPAAPAPAAPAERVEVTMDQEVFEATLEELLAKGTDRRVAEGQARRAGMIAARKKAEGEG